MQRDRNSDLSLSLSGLVSYQEGVFGTCDGVLFPTGDSEGIGERNGHRGRAWHFPVPVDG